MGNGQIEFVQLRDLVPGELGVAGERFQHASRQGCVDFLEELQVNDTETVALGQQAIALRVRDFLDQPLGPQFGELITEGRELVPGGGQAQGLDDMRWSSRVVKVPPAAKCEKRTKACMRASWRG